MSDIETVEPDAIRTASRVLASEWVPGAEPRFVRAFSNYLYSLSAAGSRLFLRITPATRRSAAELESELQIVQHLGSRGLSVAEPLPSRTGKLLHTLEQDGETLHASVFREAPGAEFADLPATARRDVLRLAGRTMGRLHTEGRGFAPAAGLQRPSWSEDRWARFAALIPEREHEAWRLHEELQAWTRGLPRDPSLFGLIHGDFTILNMRILPERITLFDFDSCCGHWYGYEIATFLHYFGGQDGAARRRAYDAVLDGYAEAAGLDDRMLAAIPRFGKMRLLYSFLVFAEAWGFERLSPTQIEYFAVRRRLFTQEPIWPSGRDGGG